MLQEKCKKSCLPEQCFYSIEVFIMMKVTIVIY